MGQSPILLFGIELFAIFVSHLDYHFHPEYCQASQMYSDTLDKAMQCVTVICGFRNVKCSSNNFSISPNDIIDEAMVLYR